MNTNVDFDRRAAAWLADGPTELADRVLDAALREVHVTRQRRVLALPWRTRRMTNPARLAVPPNLRLIAVATAVAVIGVGALTYFGRGLGVGSTPPPATTAPAAPTASPSSAPTVVGPIDSEGWIPWTSTRYGYTIAYPPTGWVPIAGDHDWELGETVPAPGGGSLIIQPLTSTGPDRFETLDRATGIVRVSVWAVDVAPSLRLASWITLLCEEHNITNPCTDPVDLGSEATPSGITGILGWKDGGTAMAAFRAGDTVYVLGIWSDGNEERVRPWGGSERVLEAFLSTMAVTEPVPGPTPS